MPGILWLQAVKTAWESYIGRLNEIMQPKSMENYLLQKIEPGITLEEFAESVFIAGFNAGEKYNRTLFRENAEIEQRLN
ncbi:MAG: hypothetical protein HGA26_01235 [Chlorobiaceae bacterium]|nr:hypothetical protein [Chlorobiaceae bacterium]